MDHETVVAYLDRSQPGHGTTLSGVLPVSAPDPG
jgi:hypothetical protein